ncbi:adenylosuccinate synthase [Patescibacteria group bacterium]
MSKLGDVVVILGIQWGDEGKGKLTDILAEKYDIVARANGGANAGHTVHIRDKKNPKKVNKFVFHQTPSGMLQENTKCLIGNGLVLNLPSLFEEVKQIEEFGIKTEGKLLIAERVQLLFQHHKEIDGIQEEYKGKGKIGTTKRGIGPCYGDKINRIGIRAAELRDWDRFVERYKSNIKMLKKMYPSLDVDMEKELEDYKKLQDRVVPYLVDASAYLNDAINSGKKILYEGANGFHLDIDHGTYPYVTSSNTSIGGMITGTGLRSQVFKDIIGVVKAYTTRVGEGPFPTELENKTGEKLREVGGEYGATTGRPRRCGWLDIPFVKYGIMICGITEINLTKIDVLSGHKKLKIATNYKLDGKKMDRFPSDGWEMEKVEADYIEMDGWNDGLTNITKFEDLPENCRKYIEKVEELCERPVRYIGVGQRRDQMIMR